MRNSNIPSVIRILKNVNKRFNIPAVTQISNKSRSPFMVLISCILSLRTKDNITMLASERLFNIAKTPEAMMGLPIKTIEKTIYPVGFYRNKAKVIKNICKELAEKYHSKVPDTIDELLKFKGVGRKTANLVV
ncbi:MAG: endonuclease III, partial [Deltaproteobacteria bacterium]|nr:endonuclease III [Deltaproteobacteria bacterium]